MQARKRPLANLCLGGHPACGRALPTIGESEPVTLISSPGWIQKSRLEGRNPRSKPWLRGQEKHSKTGSPVAVIAIAFVGIGPDAEAATGIDAEIAAL